MQPVTIEPTSGFRTLRLGELLAHRELVYFLAWRDVKVRYKQTVLGAAWAVLQPLMLVVVFTFIFGHLAGISSDGVPYPLFALAALVPWTFFSQALTSGSGSLVASSNLVSKVYFPRLAIPIATVGSHLIDLAIGLLILLAAIPWYGLDLSPRVLLLPACCLLLLVVVSGFATGLAALNVRYRDVRYAVPFLVQLFLFVSPVAYSVGELEGASRSLYAINPMVGVIESFRWSLLGISRDPTGVILVSAVTSIVLMIGSLIYFSRVERTFADVI